MSRLDGSLRIDPYPEARAHEFVWRARREPYDLVVYQIGNSRVHDYMWAYVARYPGLVVLHDARLHHARARRLLEQQRFDDYRDEFVFGQPDTNPHAAEYAIEGLSGSIYYFWPMLRPLMQTARAVAVHNRWIAGELRDRYPETFITTVRMGVPALQPAPEGRLRLRQSLGVGDDEVLFAAFGKVTAEKRVGTILRVLATLLREGFGVHLLLVGDADDYRTLPADVETLQLGRRVRVAGHVKDEAIADHLAAADVCVCLRWPTAQETSASWLRCLAARRATIISDLAHLADVPDEVTLRADLLDEEATLAAAMRRLVLDARLRDAVADAGHAYWRDHHTLDLMVADYRQLLALAASRAAPRPARLPRHFTDDYSEPARRIAQRFGMSIDVLG